MIVFLPLYESVFICSFLYRLPDTDRHIRTVLGDMIEHIAENHGEDGIGDDK